MAGWRERYGKASGIRVEGQVDDETDGAIELVGRQPSEVELGLVV
jgi:hypothetical protein